MPHITEKGAQSLAGRIVKYWTDNGFPGIRAWVTKTYIGDMPRMANGRTGWPLYVFSVRTNLHGGLPAGASR